MDNIVDEVLFRRSNIVNQYFIIFVRGFLCKQGSLNVSDCRYTTSFWARLITHAKWLSIFCESTTQKIRRGKSENRISSHGPSGVRRDHERENQSELDLKNMSSSVMFNSQTSIRVKGRLECAEHIDNTLRVTSRERSARWDVTGRKRYWLRLLFNDLRV